jgi:hypothetical protein
MPCPKSLSKAVHTPMPSIQSLRPRNNVYQNCNTIKWRIWAHISWTCQSATKCQRCNYEAMARKLILLKLDVYKLRKHAYVVAQVCAIAVFISYTLCYKYPIQFLRKSLPYLLPSPLAHLGATCNLIRAWRGDVMGGNVTHCSMKSVCNTMSTKGTPE